MTPPTTTKRLTDAQRTEQYIRPSLLKAGDRIKHGELKSLCNEFKVTKGALAKLWKRASETLDDQGTVDVRSGIKARSGRRRKTPLIVLEAKVKAAPSFKRSTLRCLAESTGIARTTLWRLLQSKVMKRCTSRLKPMQTDKHKSDRMAFVQRHLRTEASGKRYWHDMLDTVHIDEKWFYVTKQNRRYYLWSDKAVPTRKCRSKMDIMKVMFLTAVARPRYDARNKRMWDGRIGMRPFVKTRPALRSSKNRKRGDDVTEPFTVTRDVYPSFLIDKVIPAVRSKWPSSMKNQIWIQQDNAKPHVSVNDPAVIAAGRQGGWTISLCSQPAQSPDLNVLDLGYFNAIQSLQH
ncbi:hypothetical protein H257_07874 [Aphanomyces astaci]|uniref:Transposase Tc1-like domain-containing protein n=1 Tax=Aphanomyces astaci TaxID=112090 RepID=W4GF08_APHAT|nr:hypothetical protein H257_07874 [Aphanomyces astaci]ETV78282.1 hypothetical protein H257_07874 [Aphanomyces astaci]|eukprot:XP_009831863.1 hypothetical protein H257_07874 [Aphanomyces astaci]